MRAVIVIMATMILSTSLSGCFADKGGEQEIPGDTLSHFGAFSVVAPVDTGINVYHDHFSMNESYPQWLLDQLGVNMVCNISKNGTWDERYEADREGCWDLIEAGDIVWFRGSRIIGTTPDDNTEIPILDDPSDGHGTCLLYTSDAADE